MNNLDYALLELKYLVDVFVAENENKADGSWVYDLDKSLELLFEYHGTDDILEEVISQCDSSSILENISNYDIKEYLANYCDIDDFVCWNY